MPESPPHATVPPGRIPNVESVMNSNVGSADRIVRVVLGLAIVAAGLYFKSWWGAVGAVPILTATIGWCPLYTPFGLSTCGTKRAPQRG